MVYMHPFYRTSKLPSDRKIKKSLSKGTPVPGLFLIALSDREDELFTIFSDLELLHAPMKGQEFEIVGFAAGPLRAKELIRLIVEDVMNETGDISRKAVSYYFSRDTEDKKR